jgi:hypothetical protein
MSQFEAMLTGGHPNSLGRTLEVVDFILADPPQLEQLYQCYFSKDEVVRLRVSNTMKRVCRAHPDWLVPYIDRLLTEISPINQASTQWTLAQLFMELEDRMTAEQKAAATRIMQTNLTEQHDWIVLNFTMEALTMWSKDDPALREWLKPQLERLTHDTRKSVAARGVKFGKVLAKQAG